MLLLSYSCLVGMKKYTAMQCQSSNFTKYSLFVITDWFCTLSNYQFIPIMCSPASASLAKKRQIREIDWTKLRQIDWTKLRQIGRKNQSSILI